MAPETRLRALSSAHSAQSSIVGARKNTRRPGIRVIPDSDSGTSAKRNILVYSNVWSRIVTCFPRLDVGN